MAPAFARVAVMAGMLVEVPSVALIAPAIAGVVTVFPAPRALKVAFGLRAATEVARNAGTSGSTKSCTHDGTRCASDRLAHGSTRRAADGATNDGVVLMAAMAGNRCTRGPAQGPTDDGPVFAPHVLAKDCTGSSTRTTAQQRRPVTGVYHR